MFHQRNQLRNLSLSNQANEDEEVTCDSSDVRDSAEKVCHKYSFACCHSRRVLLSLSIQVILLFIVVAAVVDYLTRERSMYIGRRRTCHTSHFWLVECRSSWPYLFMRHTGLHHGSSFTIVPGHDKAISTWDPYNSGVVPFMLTELTASIEPDSSPGPWLLRNRHDRGPSDQRYDPDPKQSEIPKPFSRPAELKPRLQEAERRHDAPHKSVKRGPVAARHTDAPERPWWAVTRAGPQLSLVAGAEHVLGGWRWRRARSNPFARVDNAGQQQQRGRRRRRVRVFHGNAPASRAARAGQRAQFPEHGVQRRDAADVHLSGAV